ncbi:MAG: c-type cytochrome domain-containing protein, partial [Verrucomicrobiota bacterium]|nr:c-type cytochrome domain-containing protein [Verrucomicrobiota bacterium]
MRTLLAILLSGVGAIAQESELPRPAERKVDFATDIRPLFERSCLKCHGDKRPKSDFRLTSRESALAGGKIGVAILPGDSANSPLVHYIAGLIEDSEMPPEGKAPALSDAEIGLVRGWIDQGAAWLAPSETVFTAEPVARWISLSGSAEAFRQHWGMTPGLSLGLGQVTATGQTKRGANVEFDGRFIGGDEDHLAR